MFAFGGILLLVLNATVPQVHERVERTSQALTADEAGLDDALSGRGRIWGAALCMRSEEHTSELQSLMRISYAVFCLKQKNTITQHLKSTTIYPISPHTTA